MFEVASVMIIIALILAVVAVLRGPTLFDRVIAGNAIGTLCVLLLLLMGYVFGRPEFHDLAVTYVLLNVIGTIAVLKYFRYGNLGSEDTDPEKDAS